MHRSQNPKTRSGFSLVEVILAIGVFALTIVAVLGLLGPIAQQVRELRDSNVANGLPSLIRDEMNRLGFSHFVNADFTGYRRESVDLYATQDGGEVGEADQLEEEQRYFLIELEAPADEDEDEEDTDPDTANLRYQNGDAHVTYKVTISWPYRLPDGSEVDMKNRNTFSYYTAIVVGEPF